MRNCVSVYMHYEINIYILRQDKENLNITFFSALWPPPSPLLCISQTPQGQKYLLNHKVQLFFRQPCTSLEDNIPSSVPKGSQ